ncbi:ferritin family protein [Vallitalea guaymasensis]|uniref:Rubrerythrin diiron-binding domain-containing protein n=1 Tax=Vallitalea guaymasensis TaxID=1185412 RepID=A0A8J8MA09_9FIRM|nr:ferritin-like domain-containing protein [Vallitalea guaymasensis]QUH29132.1 hypothetical protein HYG85_09425 [Vallitalea guaymasensis]
MSYTTEGQPQGIANKLTNCIRESLISEIVAINQYNYHIHNSTCPSLVKLWMHIRDEEIRHFSMFSELLRKYDPMQQKLFEETKGHVNIDYSNCFSLKSDTRINIPNSIRSDIKGELEAVILYEYVLTSNKYRDVYEVYNEVINEEKEHFEELSFAIKEYDTSFGIKTHL